MKKLRRYVTLLELLIAMALAMLVMSALAYFYRQIELISRDMDAQQSQLFTQLYVSTRLSDVIPKTHSPQAAKNEFYFFTSSAGDANMLPGMPNLVFTYDNGIKMDTRFSAQVLGRLFVDKHHRLCLGVWPVPSHWEELHLPPMKIEVLLENVDTIAFRFYIPPKKEREKIWKQAKMKVTLPDNFPLSEVGEWRTDWPAGWMQLPAIVEVILTRKNETTPLKLAYPLPNTNFMVVY